MSRLLNQREVCDMLGICPASLQRLRKKRKIRWVQIGYRSIRFRPEDVENFVSKRLRAIAYAKEVSQ